MSKSPNGLRGGEGIKKLWQHDEEAEQEKSRTIYAQQLKELGLGSGNESTPLHQDTSLRIDYVKKMHYLLKPKGKIIGLLFDFQLTEVGPPFGGTLDEYKNLFKSQFEIKVLEKAYNSIKPRLGSELFFIFEKK